MDDLTNAEHELAQELAYQRAVERGNGELPEFDGNASEEDFFKAVEEVISKRSQIKLLETGVHFFPIQQLFDFEGNEVVGAEGYFKWSIENGINFEFTIPFKSNYKLRQHQFGELTSPMLETDWTGLTGGKRFTLRCSVPNRIANKLFAGAPAKTLLSGEAVFADVDLSLDHELACQHDTPSKNREFVSGFGLSFWPQQEEIQFENGSVKSEWIRNHLSIQDEPHLSISNRSIGSTKVHGDGIWLLDGGPEPQTGNLSTPISQELKSFLSFLAGRQVETYWRDRLTCEGIKRVYAGVKRPNQITEFANTQPIPLFKINDSFDSKATAVVSQLPQLFFRFRGVLETHKLNFVLSPLRQARAGVIEDTLALASVSIERFASQRKAFLKTTASNGPKPRLLGTRQSENSLRKLLKRTATKFVKEEVETGDSDNQILIISKSIDNMLQVPNSMKLAGAFESTGLQVSEVEDECLQLRNVALHGNSAMDDLELDSFKSEIHRVDVLRTLVAKAVLKLIEYEGPYCDYGAKPLECTIKQMTLNTVDH